MYVCIYVGSMFVCMYACIHACIHMCLYVCMFTCMYESNAVCIHAYRNARMYAHMCYFVFYDGWYECITAMQINADLFLLPGNIYMYYIYSFI